MRHLLLKMFSQEVYAKLKDNAIGCGKIICSKPLFVSFQRKKIKGFDINL